MEVQILNASNREFLLFNHFQLLLGWHFDLLSRRFVLFILFLFLLLLLLLFVIFNLVIIDFWHLIHFELPLLLGLFILIRS